MTHEGRLELLAAAVIGAALGIVTGYVLGKPLLAILIWALIGALVVTWVSLLPSSFAEQLNPVPLFMSAHCSYSNTTCPS
jgi:hypothetical protein